jgi:processive 1,2-diacylglycerol beta-glucosyltransferase
MGERGRVMIVSARVGAGHNGFTEELARRLRIQGFEVDTFDFMDFMPGPAGRESLRTYNRILRRAPWIYAALFGIGNRSATTALTRLLLVPTRRRLLKLVQPDVRVVVSTYSLASQVLGPLRRSGRLRVPTVTYNTDFAVHRHWVASGVDAHLTAHPLGAQRAHALGGDGAQTAGALVAPGFHPAAPAEKEAAREAFGLPSGRLALVVAGSWGVGRIESTAVEVEATGVATPVVVCGRNDELRRRLIASGIRYALGWVDDMPRLMRAVDVLIENAGGLMALEGMASGLPVATYRPIPGHGELSAAALSDAGVSMWIRGPDALGRGLTQLMESDRDRQATAAQVMFRRDAAMSVARIADQSPPAPSVHMRRTSPVGLGVAVARGVAVGVGLAVVVGAVDHLARRNAASKPASRADSLRSSDALLGERSPR